MTTFLQCEDRQENCRPNLCMLLLWCYKRKTPWLKCMHSQLWTVSQSHDHMIESGCSRKEYRNKPIMETNKRKSGNQISACSYYGAMK